MTATFEGSCSHGQSLPLEHMPFLKNLRSVGQGTAGGPSNGRNEHFKVVLDDEAVADSLCDAAERLAQADVPHLVANAIRLARLTALSKPQGGVRSIATGDILRRLVARTLAQTYGE